MYTLQSMSNGRYISSLYSRQHAKVFQGRSRMECYTWPSLEAVEVEKRRHERCLIVKIEDK